jgi:formyl-CoA transferase
MIETAVLPDGITLDVPGIVPKLTGTPGRTRWLGPSLGEHVGEVLGRIGIDGAELEALRADGVV